jgi:hypothetical protein
MAKAADVLEMLIPTGGWEITGEDFDSIRYDEGVKPISKKQFDDGFAKYDAWKAEQDAAKAQAKAALLERLGLTQEEFNTLTA